MSQYQLEDVEILNNMDEMMDDLELEIQNAVSMASLNVSIEEAFAKSTKMIDEIGETIKTIIDEDVKEMGMLKLKEAMELMDSNISKLT